MNKKIKRDALFWALQEALCDASQAVFRHAGVQAVADIP